MIILCADNEDETISEGLKNFLVYLSGKPAQDDFTKRLHTAVSRGRMSKEWRREYMLMSEYLEDAKAEGRAEGRVEGRVEGEAEGMAAERSNGIRIFIEDKREDGISEQIIREKLILRYKLTQEEAQKYLDEK